MLKALIATVTMLILDGLWLNVIAKKLYFQEMGHLMRLSAGSLQPNWMAVVIVYAVMIAGILLFVIPKSHGIPSHALLWGAVFGLVVYATYDFTNLAVLSNWSVKISLIDTAWGIVLCGVTSFMTVLLSR